MKFKPLIISSFYLLIISLFSLWFQKIWFESFWIGLVVFFTSIALVYKYFNDQKKIRRSRKKIEILPLRHTQNQYYTLINYLIIFAFFVCTVLQISTTDIKNAYLYTPSQIDSQIQRMRYYPIKLTRLAYWLEYKKETLLFYKFKENAIDVLDIKQYFPNFYSYSLSPFVLAGLYQFFKRKNNLLFSFSAFSLLLLAIIGVHGKFGPFLLFPFINLWGLIGIDKMMEIIKFPKHQMLG